LGCDRRRHHRLGKIRTTLPRDKGWAYRHRAWQSGRLAPLRPAFDRAHQGAKPL